MRGDCSWKRPGPRRGRPVRCERSFCASDRAAATFAIPDRKEAIQFAIRKAEPGDLVLLAGKGHEQTQLIGSTELPFDEAAIARDALERRR